MCFLLFAFAAMDFFFEIHNIDLYTFIGRDENKELAAQDLETFLSSYQIVKISDLDKNFHQGRDRKLLQQSNC